MHRSLLIVLVGVHTGVAPVSLAVLTLLQHPADTVSSGNPSLHRWMHIMPCRIKLPVCAFCCEGATWLCAGT